MQVNSVARCVELSPANPFSPVPPNTNPTVKDPNHTNHHTPHPGPTLALSPLTPVEGRGPGCTAVELSSVQGVFQAQRADIFIATGTTTSELRRSGIVEHYVAPMGLSLICAGAL